LKQVRVWWRDIVVYDCRRSHDSAGALLILVRCLWAGQQARVAMRAHSKKYTSIYVATHTRSYHYRLSMAHRARFWSDDHMQPDGQNKVSVNVG